MTKRYDVASPRTYRDRDGGEKTSWNNLGVAFEKDGRITVLLNALPMPQADGQAKLVLMEPRQDGGRSEQRSSAPDRGFSGGRATADLDDDVPF